MVITIFNINFVISKQKNAPNSRIFFCFKVEAPELLNSYYLLLQNRKII